MKTLKNRISLIGALPVLLMALSALILVSGQLPGSQGQPQERSNHIRPVRDDVGFCWNPDSMKILVDYLASQEKEHFRAEGLVAAISPTTITSMPGDSTTRFSILSGPRKR